MIKKILTILSLFVLLASCKSDKQSTSQAITVIKPAETQPGTQPTGPVTGQPWNPSQASTTNYLPEIARQIEFIPDWRDVTWGPFKLVDPPGITNPVLSIEDVTDRDATSVADPFLFHENSQWYMFMEVFDRPTSGDIGLARSQDGLHWTYDRIVLDEPFHLSYPYVFKIGNTYYMMPETFQMSEVRIYKAENFPYDWTYLATLIKGRPFVDPSILYHDGRFWLFVSVPTNRELFLYSSDSLTENWVEHPQSPVIRGTTENARPGGRSFIYNGDTIIRIAQNWGGGLKVRAYKVDILTQSEYAEHQIAESPLLQPGPEPEDWYVGGIHHFDPWWTGEYWIAAFDGRAEDRSFRIGIKVSK